jgi:hypothetical protein
MVRRRAHRAPLALAALVTCAAVGPAAAQDLPTLLAAGRANGRDLATARARADQASATAALARAPLWPTLTVAGGYTRNQHASIVPLGDAPLTIVPLDQLGATATLTVPLLDLAARAPRSRSRSPTARSPPPSSRWPSGPAIASSSAPTTPGSAAPPRRPRRSTRGRSRSTTWRWSSAGPRPSSRRRSTSPGPRPRSPTPTPPSLAPGWWSPTRPQLATATGAPPVGPPPALPVDDRRRGAAGLVAGRRRR